ncbi:MAG: UvrB/UvrC motif-containing protein [Sedimentisphaerales bacterium]|nr:UvrB/UvrC motif-containing protein [Sedimentisphaerales bacterium]
MQCQMCDKHATVHLTEIINGQKMERHLCDECAQKEGITVKTHQIPINELFSNLVDAQQESRELADLNCPQCKIKWTQFRKEGLLGCPNDYLAFEKPLRTLIERAQDGATSHVGKVPKNSEGKMADQLKLLRFRQELYKALEQEDYETAVRLRDEIRKFEMN